MVEDHAASGMQPAEEFSTLVHEIAHEMLHRGDRRTLTTNRSAKRGRSRGLCGLQSSGSERNFIQDYIQLWHGDASLLRESLEPFNNAAVIPGHARASGSRGSA